MHSAMRPKLAVLLFAAAASCAVAASSDDVVTFSFQVFDNTAMQNLYAVSNSGFGSAFVLPGFNNSEGFLLLSPEVNFWRAGARGVTEREASFNTTFTLAGSSPVAFVVLKDVPLTLNSPDGFRGPANATSAEDGRASAGSLGAVEVGTVKSYGRDNPAVGLNVTIAPNNGTALSRTVWIDYNATAHRLSVYVAAGGQPKPANATLNAALDLARRTTETASVGFFADPIRGIVTGVSRWELKVDAQPNKSNGNRIKETSWVMILLAVLMAAAAI